MREHGVGFRTVKAALESVWPEPRKRPRPRGTRLDAYKPLIDQMLRVDLDAPRKQRHTVKRIFDRLVDEHAAQGVTYPMVRAYVAERRPQIKVEAGRGPVNAFIPQTYRPGAEAEVDFGDMKVRLAGELVTCYLFAMRLCYSGKAVHRVFASCGQEAFLEGHVHALSVLGGVPTGKVRYDNLKAAVARVLGSRARAENERWTAFRSHYAIEAAYCLPGIEGAHEKPLSSHCTSSGRCGVFGVQGALAGPADDGPDQAGAGQGVEVLALVVGQDAGDDAVAAPVLDGLEVDAEVAGEFGDGQQARVEQALAVAA
ncbi:hypothetical protein OG734_44860 [Streptomyces sp. NBC_00576]|nr:hypothetical protein [Streptomyces sp. NBC_00576]WUB76612.1 hypothetical protein OG734_44860 [Streptomyces sp. NBC_00576]